MLPAMAKAELARHLEAVHTQHHQDLAAGAGWVELPTALSGNTRTRAGNGSGSGSSRPHASTGTG